MDINAGSHIRLQPGLSQVQSECRDGAEDKALRQVCREFESILVTQMLTKMRESVPKNDLFGSQQKEEVFQSLLDVELAKEMSSTGALGLGDIMYLQLRGQNTAKASTEAVDTYTGGESD